MRGQGLILPEGSTLLALEETRVTAYGEHTYKHTRCLWIEDGSEVFHITNVASDNHNLNYQRIDG